MWGRSQLALLALLALLSLPALAGCGPPPNRTTVTSAWYTFSAPGSFESVTPSLQQFPEVENPATLTTLRDPKQTQIYAAVRRPAAGIALSDLLRSQHIVAALGVSRPIPVTIGELRGMRIDGLRATGEDGGMIAARSYALRAGGSIFVIGCRWSVDPEGAHEACQQAVESFEPS